MDVVNGNLNAVNGNSGPVNGNLGTMKKTATCWYYQQIALFDQTSKLLFFLLSVYYITKCVKSGIGLTQAKINKNIGYTVLWFCISCSGSDLSASDSGRLLFYLS